MVAWRRVLLLADNRLAATDLGADLVDPLGRVRVLRVDREVARAAEQAWDRRAALSGSGTAKRCGRIIQ